MTTATLHPHQVQELDLTLERERRWLIEHIRVLEALPTEPPEESPIRASDETGALDWHRDIWTQMDVPALSSLVEAIVGERTPEDTRAALDSVYQESLDEVEDALSRIDHGTYGVCEHCGGGIYPPHLARVPWARYCRRCTVRPVTGRIDGGVRPSTADVADAVREYRIVKALVD